MNYYEQRYTNQEQFLSQEYVVSDAKTLVAGNYFFEVYFEYFKRVENSFSNILLRCFRVAVLMLLLILLLPLFNLFGVLVYYQRRKVKKRMKINSSFDFTDANDYVNFKNGHQKLGELLNKLKPLLNSNPRKEFFLFRFPLVQMYLLGKILVTYYNWHNRKLRSFNKPNGLRSTDSELKFKSEQDLWESRNNAYQYAM